jgi:hypothetical protein
MTRVVRVVLVGLVCSFVYQIVAATTCTRYTNSTPSTIWGMAVCAGSGSGCTECYEEQSGASCVTDGQSCQPWPKDQQHA